VRELVYDRMTDIPTLITRLRCRAISRSSVFGPVKYSILPQLLEDDQLVGGNALVESGTFLAILLGTRRPCWSTRVKCLGLNGRMTNDDA
jgi:hypothetical protein